jgi:hypothetical protein
MKTNFGETDEVNFASSGIKKSFTASGDLRGLAVVKCQQPQTDFWFLGGDTHIQSTTKLILTNPADAAAQVMLTVWGDDDAEGGRSDDGSLKYSAGRYVGVNAKSEVAVNLSAGAQGQKMLAVHVQALTTPIAATIQTSSIAQLAAQGVEYANAQALTQNSVIPGVLVAKNGGKNTSTLGLIAPNDDKAKVKVRFLPYDSGKKSVEKSLDFDGRTVDLESLDFLEDGVWTLEIDSEQPILATVEQTEKTDDGLRELAFNNPAPLGENQLLTLDDADSVQVYYTGEEAQKYSLIGYSSAGAVTYSAQVSFEPNETKIFAKDALKGSTILTILAPTTDADSNICASARWEHPDRLSVSEAVPIHKNSTHFGFGFLE